MRPLFPILALCATTLTAESLPPSMICEGNDPDWTLEITGDAATFDFRRTSEMSLMLSTPAEGYDWPVALTFVGRGDSVILIAEKNLCGEAAHGARILTQRGETPLLLTGCCYER